MLQTHFYTSNGRPQRNPHVKQLPADQLVFCATKNQ